MTDNTIEIWKDIKGYEGLYQISNLGNVKSLNYHNQGFEKILTNSISNGYYIVRLCKNKKIKKFYVHRLVAQHFILNPNNYPLINHKDENRLNNNIKNLEWCTYSYNNTYNNLVKKKLETKKKNNSFSRELPVKQFTLDNKYIRTIKSISEASRIMGTTKTNIWKCCRGIYKQAKGYIWKYAE